MTDFNFAGTPDGIGNRIEQIILLEAVSKKEQFHVNYIWNNKYFHRDYKVFITTKHVTISNKAIENLPFQWQCDPEVLYKTLRPFDRNELLDAASNITPTFQIGFEKDKEPVGVHI